MVWGSGPPTVVVGDVIAAATGNLYRDLFLETAPAKATAAGQLFRATGAGALEAFAVGSAGQVLGVAGGLPAWTTPAVPTLATLPIVPSARVYGGPQSIPDNSWTTLTFDTEMWDTDAIHSTVTNPDRLTCKTAGIYLVQGTLEFAANLTGERRGRILVNGTENDLACWTASSLASFYHVNVWGFVNLAVNDYVQLQVLQTSGGSINVNSVFGPRTPSFGMTYLGRAS